MKQEKILILGIGNTIRGDDVIGLLLARELAKEKRAGVEIRELETSGFEILDEMAGYEKIIIIDAMRTDKEEEIGEVVSSCLDDRVPTVTLMPSHGFDFAGLVQTFRQAQPESYQAEICFILVKVMDVDEFREGMSEVLEKRLDLVVNHVKSLVLQKVKMES